MKHCMWTVPRRCTNDHQLRSRYADPTLVGSSKIAPGSSVHPSLTFDTSQRRGILYSSFGILGGKMASFEIEGQIDHHKSCIFPTTQIMIYTKIIQTKKNFASNKKTLEPFFTSALHDLPKQTANTPLFVYFFRRLLRKGSEFLRASATSAGLRKRYGIAVVALCI